MTKMLSERLYERLKKHPVLSGYIRGNGICARNDCARRFLSDGAWRFTVEHEGAQPIGSCYTMKECMDAPYLEVWIDGAFGVEFWPSETGDNVFEG